MPRSPILDEWAAAGLEEVLLPQSGLWCRVRLPSPEQLARRRMLPKALVAAVVEAQGDASKWRSAVSDEESEGMADELFAFRDGIVSLMVKALRHSPDEEWQPVTLAPGEVGEVIPDRDLEALRAIGERRTTVGIVTAVARKARGELTEEEAAAIVNAETERTVTGWASFRGVGGSEGASVDGESVGGPTVLADRRRRSGRRAGAG